MINVKCELYRLDTRAEHTETTSEYTIFLNTNIGVGICFDEHTNFTNITEVAIKSVINSIKCNEVECNKMYSLWKDGRLYYVHGIVADYSNPNKVLVLYQALYGIYKYYLRPYELFVSEVDKNREADNKTGQKYRFELVE